MSSLRLPADELRKDDNDADSTPEVVRFVEPRLSDEMRLNGMSADIRLSCTGYAAPRKRLSAYDDLSESTGAFVNPNGRLSVCGG